MTTWASAISEVPLAASSLPTFVASTRSRTATSVAGWRISRASRACRSGRRVAWASAVAGTVTAAPVSRARARSTSTRRSFLSRAISPPASTIRHVERSFPMEYVTLAAANDADSQLLNIDEHQVISRAIRRRNGAGARLEMKNHVLHLGEKVIRYLDDHHFWE
jgi:hypothetical protein